MRPPVGVWKRIKKGINMKKTSFTITTSTAILQYEILKAIGDMSKIGFHRRAIDYYLKYDRSVHPDLLITERKNPRYVRKDTTEQIYLDDDRFKEIKKVAAELGCPHTIVLCHALMSFCSIQAPLVLDQERLDYLMGKIDRMRKEK